MSLPEFYAAVAQEVNNSDICLSAGPWERQSPTNQEFFGLLYCMVTNGAFDRVPRKNRATMVTQSKLP